MKKKVYTVSYETKTANSLFYGIAIREKESGELAKLFIEKVEQDGDIRLISIDAILYIQSLVNNYNAVIEWNINC